MSDGVLRRAGVPALLACALLVPACGADVDDGTDDPSAAESAGFAAPAQQTSFGDFAAPTQDSPTSTDSDSTATDQAGAEATGPVHPVPVPGLAKEFTDQIPAETSQVLVATSPTAASEKSSLSFYEFTDKKWKKLKTFDTHNGSKGWLKDRREGDKTTPIGVFTLSDAGGFKANPGTDLPYTQDNRLPSSATVAYGADYESVFDYIIAIDYNRRPGTPPTDKTRPMGWDKGGGIWLHLDHGSGTNGCVTLDEADLKWIMRTIDPDAHPRIAMGPAPEVKK
ncbi:L,D-transpeptidase family protein [Brevibacterium sp. JSBI002]|uniref:L,D-transpeptidase family protein n=1 Tax=Brevibacterium sp. JSBI002 TaxID=2886045 RepID=UPI00222F4F8B|nr:L,D-transpeptidase family protein [Brevibacterium sp. JSBI002]UZD60950.1 L,D-transpeptidase family protein [Brevibacterium sp. JSBI002]